MQQIPVPVRVPSHAIHGPSLHCETSVAGHMLYTFTSVAFSPAEVNICLNTSSSVSLFLFQKPYVSMLFLDSEDSQSLKLVFNILLFLPSFSEKNSK